ncbi:MAG: glycosyltransferase family 2 protein [Desulfomonilaceae bacterium]
MNLQPHFSIIVAVYNRAATLQRCIDSVVNQTYPRKELIIVDGGSTDGSVDILRQNEHLIDYWESKPDRGIYHAFNKGIDHARGEWIYFLGSDDYLIEPEVMSRVARNLMTCEPEIRIVYGKAAIVSRDGLVLATQGEDYERTKRKLHKFMPICHQGIFHRRSLFESGGGFDESFRVLGDYELLLRELKDRPAKFMADTIVAAIQLGGASTRPAEALIVPMEEARARKLNGFPVHPPAWLWVLIKAFGRYSIHRSMGHKAFCRIGDFYRQLTGRPPVWTKM